MLNAQEGFGGGKAAFRVARGAGCGAQHPTRDQQVIARFLNAFDLA